MSCYLSDEKIPLSSTVQVLFKLSLDELFKKSEVTVNANQSCPEIHFLDLKGL